MNPIIMMNRNNLFFTANYAFPHNCNISDSVSDVNRKMERRNTYAVSLSEHVSRVT